MATPQGEEVSRTPLAWLRRSDSDRLRDFQLQYQRDDPGDPLFYVLTPAEIVTARCGVRGCGTELEQFASEWLFCVFLCCNAAACITCIKHVCVRARVRVLAHTRMNACVCGVVVCVRCLC